jgi:hypothetical protein
MRLRPGAKEAPKYTSSSLRGYYNDVRLQSSIRALLKNTPAFLDWNWINSYQYLEVQFMISERIMFGRSQDVLGTWGCVLSQKLTR